MTKTFKIKGDFPRKLARLLADTQNRLNASKIGKHRRGTLRCNHCLAIKIADHWHLQLGFTPDNGRLFIDNQDTNKRQWYRLYGFYDFRKLFKILTALESD